MQGGRLNSRTQRGEWTEEGRHGQQSKYGRAARRRLGSRKSNQSASSTAGRASTVADRPGNLGGICASRSPESTPRGRRRATASAAKRHILQCYNGAATDFFKSASNQPAWPSFCHPSPRPLCSPVSPRPRGCCCRCSVVVLQPRVCAGPLLISPSPCCIYPWSETGATSPSNSLRSSVLSTTTTNAPSPPVAAAVPSRCPPHSDRCWWSKGFARSRFAAASISPALCPAPVADTEVLPFRRPFTAPCMQQHGKVTSTPGPHPHQ